MDKQFDWCYFVVADKQSWRDEGVLVVTFKDQNGNVDMARFRAREVGLTLLQFPIANRDWEEQKACFGIGEG